MGEKRYLFHEIKIGSEFTLFNDKNIILVKVDEKNYVIKGQSRLWRGFNFIEYTKYEGSKDN